MSNPDIPTRVIVAGRLILLRSGPKVLITHQGVSDPAVWFKMTVEDARQLYGSLRTFDSEGLLEE